jgi:hypothetical protein
MAGTINPLAKPRKNENPKGNQEGAWPFVAEAMSSSCVQMKIAATMTAPPRIPYNA